MSKEAMKLALEALIFNQANWQGKDKAVAALKQALEQPEPEPVAWGIANTRPTESNPLMMVMLDEPPPSHLVIPLYISPPKREWHGLTDEDKQIAFDDTQEGGGFWEFADAIEATLRKKNHG